MFRILMLQGETTTHTPLNEQGMLTRRPNLPQWVHDRVVETVAAHARGYAAYTNTGGHHSVCLTGSFPEVSPDVIICDPESFLVDHVVEVETDESFERPVIERWVNIAHAVHGRGQFWILVPPAAAPSVTRLCRQHGIRAKVGTWSVDSQGVLISWPAPIHAAPVSHA